MKIKFSLVLSFSVHLLLAQEFNDLPAYNNLQIIHHTHYSLAYSEPHEQAAWVAYRLDKSELLGPYERKNDFRADIKVNTGSSSLIDYKNSGYDRGHLTPAEDHTFSALAMSETFYMSNMCPQQSGFNRGQWSALENAVRKWAFHFDSLFIITGPVLTQFIDTIGVENTIPVPKYFYKAIYSFTPTDTLTIAFILPNHKVDSYKNYAVSIDSLEQLSGINFFPNTVDNKHEIIFDSHFWFEILDQITLPSKASSYQKTTSSVCKGTTLKGNPCKNKTTNNNGYCHLHQP